MTKTNIGKKPSVETMKENRVRWFQKPYPLREQRISGPNSRGIYYKDCVYYYWFEYLKLSSSYKKACENNGKGMEILYADFGNIYDIDFMDWWEQKDEQSHMRGACLFGDTKFTKMESFITLGQALELRAEIDSEKYKLLAVPTNATKKELSRAFTLLLRDLEVKEQKRISTAKYQIYNFRVTANTLKKSLDAWNLKESGKYTGAIIGAMLSRSDKAHKDLKEIAAERELEELILKMKERMGKRQKMGSSHDTDGKYASFSVTAIRALNRVSVNIRAAENGVFPVSSKAELKKLGISTEGLPS